MMMREKNLGGLWRKGKTTYSTPSLKSIRKLWDKSSYRWLTQRGVVVIPKSVRKERILENINIFDFELAQEDMDRIAALDTKVSLYPGSDRNPETVKWLSNYKANL
jgi:diketogulonate reductase-like aldo/keto reductase